jgi:hypothetical protein
MARDKEKPRHMQRQMPETIEEMDALEAEAQEFFLEIRELQCAGAMPLYSQRGFDPYQWDSGYCELECLERYYDAQPL